MKPKRPKTGQRWKYDNKLGDYAIIEPLEDYVNTSIKCRILQRSKSFDYANEESYWFDGWPRNYTYLEGQDKPTN